MHHKIQEQEDNRDRLNSSIKDLLRTLHPHAETAFQAVSAAGAVVRAGAASSGGMANYDRKGLGDLVTAVDIAAEKAAINELRAATPHYAIVSEESCRNQLAVDRPTWVLDPLDGTAAFIFRTDPKHPSVMLALYSDRHFELGMVYRPLVDEWYFAARGKGAYFVEPGRGVLQLGRHVHGGRLADGWVALNWYGDSAYEGEDMSMLLKDLRRPGGAQITTVLPPHSSAGCDVVARGAPLAVVHDNAPVKVKQELWDIAPVRLIVEEAGGVFMDVSGRRYVNPSQGVIVIAASPAVGAEVIACRKGEAQVQLLEVACPNVQTLFDFFMAHGVNEWNYLPPTGLRQHLEQIASGDVRAVLAFKAGLLVGVATFEVGRFYPELSSDPKTERYSGYVSEVTVHREYQKQGIGALLLQRAVECLGREDVKDVFAKRHEENSGSAGMMRKAGFTICNVFEDPIRTHGSRRTVVERLVLAHA